MVLLWFLIPYLGMFAVSFRWPVFLDRYLLFTSLGLFVMIAALIDLFAFERWMKFAFIFALFAIMAYKYTLDPGNGRDLQSVTKVIRENRVEQDPVVISPDYAYLEFVYHYDINMFRLYDQTKELLMKEHIYPIRQLNDVEDSTILKSDRVLYLDCGSEFAFGANPLREELSAYFTQTKVIHHDSVYTITRFSK
jgi:hypothetical protein